MNWNERENAQTKDEAVEALLDGIAQGVKVDELEAYAFIWTIPLSLQSKPTQTVSTQPPVATYPDAPATSLPTVEEDDDDEEWEEDYDDEDYDDYDDDWV